MRRRSGFTIIEMLVVISIIAIILALGAPPFLKWYTQSKVEDNASTLQEDIKSAQIEAQRQGEVDVVAGNIQKRKIYIALNPDNNSYKVVRWQDNDGNNLRDTAEEFTTIMEKTLTNSKFGFDASVNKIACGENSRTSSESMTNITATTCPDLPIFAGYRCSRFNGNGFNDGMNNGVIYITNGTYTSGVTLNPAGLTALCRWTGSGWANIR